MNEAAWELAREAYIRKHGEHPVIISFENDPQNRQSTEGARKEMQALDALGIKYQHLVIRFVSPTEEEE